MEPTESIAERAHALWEAEGKPEGRDQEFWFVAEAQLQEQQAQQDASGDAVPLAAVTMAAGIGP